MSHPQILIVEDDLDWQEIYRRSLRGAGYEITAARKVREQIKDRLQRSLEKERRGARGIPAQDVAAQLGLEW